MSWRNGPTACKRAHTPHTEHRLDALEAWADHRIASRAGPSRAVAVATHCKSLACGGYIAARDLLHAPARLASVRRSSAPAAMATQHTTAQKTTSSAHATGLVGQPGGIVRASIGMGQCSAVLCCRYVPRPIRAEKPKELNRKPPKVPHAPLLSDAPTSANFLAMCRTQFTI
jgi:hypothetical protein